MNNKLNQWLAFIDDTDRRLIKMAEEKNKVLEKARIEINYLTGDAEARRLEELREKWEMDRISALDYANKKGIKQGEKEKTKEIVRKLLEQKVSIEIVMAVTGLTKEEIKNINS